MTALGRVVRVLLGYALLAALVLQGGFWLEDVLVLPPLFGRLLVGMVALGLPLAIAVAWRYPEIGSFASEPTVNGSNPEPKGGEGAGRSGEGGPL